MDNITGRTRNRQAYQELFDNHVDEIIQERADFL